MPTIVRSGGVEIRILTADHPPAHIHAVKAGKNLVLSWGTNWTGYALYSATSLSTTATWTKVTNSPVVNGALNMMTNTMPQAALFYRLLLP